jgi:hypothetical protein
MQPAQQQQQLQLLLLPLPPPAGSIAQLTSCWPPKLNPGAGYSDEHGQGLGIAGCGPSSAQGLTVLNGSDLSPLLRLPLLLMESALLLPGTAGPAGSSSVDLSLLNVGQRWSLSLRSSTAFIINV